MPCLRFSGPALGLGQCASERIGCCWKPPGLANIYRHNSSRKVMHDASRKCKQAMGDGGPGSSSPYWAETGAVAHSSIGSCPSLSTSIPSTAPHTGSGELTAAYAAAAFAATSGPHWASGSSNGEAVVLSK